MSYQKLILVGNLGSEPEMRFTAEGTPVTNFSLAVNRTYTVNDQKVEEVTWFRVACWQRMAEIAADYLKKGYQVMIEARLAPEIRIWTDQQGTQRASYEVTCERLVLLANRDNADPAQAQPAQPQARAPQRAPMAPVQGYAQPDDLDDPPF